MLLIEVIVWAGLGLIFGSFINVLILRHGTGKTVGGRSECLSCAQTLTWLDLWPILSWVAFGGKCRSCGSAISLQYPLVEASTMGLFVLMGLAPVPLGVKIVGCAVILLMTAIAVYDLYHTIIPNAWVYPLIPLSLLYVFLAHPLVDAYSLVYFGIAGPLAALPLFILWAVSSGTWMGFGDVKLALPVGWILGPALGVQSILVAFFIGAIVGIVLLSLPRLVAVFHMLRIRGPRIHRLGYTMRSEVPFGPFVIVSFFILWFAALYAIDLPLPPVLLS